MGRAIGAAATLLVCLAAHASAQTAQAFSAQGSALYSGLSGDAYAGFKAGYGVEGQIRYTTTTGFSFGAGYQRTTHEISGHAENATLAGPFFEPRYAFLIKGQETLFPYVSLRLASLKQSVSINGANSSASGFTANAGGGILIAVSSRANLDVGATFGMTNFSNFVLIDASTGQRISSGKTGSGTNYVVRAGLAIGLF